MTSDELARLKAQLERAEAIRDRAAVTMLKARIRRLDAVRVRAALEVAS